MTAEPDVGVVGFDEYELYMPLLEAMRHDLEETLADRSDAIFYPGRAVVVNRFLATLRRLIGHKAQDLPVLDESHAVAALNVFTVVQRYYDVFLGVAPNSR